ncbi:MAG: B12-binding domain-containing radical SAM protein [Acidobacteriota bacterium]
MEKRVVLIYPYFRERDPVQKLFQPLGISYLASQLRDLGIPVAMVDCTFKTFESAISEIVSMNPALIGISIMVSQSRNALALAQEIRTKLPETLLVAGGPLPTLYPENFSSSFDVIFRGESDLIFPRFCRAYLDSSNPAGFLNNIYPRLFPGIYLTSQSGIVCSPSIHHNVTELNKLPTPERSGIDHAQYQKCWQEAAGCKTASIMITRGCPFTCDFCSKPVWGNSFRKPALDNVFNEITEISALGYDQLWIADDSFTLDLNYLRDFCWQKLARKIPITWTCLSRTDGLDKDTVQLMQDAGCVKVYLGLESGSDETLRLMSKKTTVQGGIDTAKLFDSVGIKTAGFFMIGYPGETMASIERTLKHALEMNLDEISFNVPYPLPGSALFARVSGIQQGEDWERASAARFLYRSEFDESELKNRIAQTMSEFNNRKLPK